MAHSLLSQRDSVVDQFEQMHQRIARRAYEMFRGRDGWGDPFGDWLAAEQELVWKPAVELREQDGTYTLSAALPGLRPQDINVDITPNEVVIKAATEHTHSEDKGQIHRCEFTTGQVFRAVPFPKTVDPAKATAKYENGLLNVTAPIAPDGRTTRVPVKAA